MVCLLHYALLAFSLAFGLHELFFSLWINKICFSGRCSKTAFCSRSIILASYLPLSLFITFNGCSFLFSQQDGWGVQPYPERPETFLSRVVPEQGLIGSCHTVTTALCQLIYLLLPLPHSSGLVISSLVTEPGLKLLFFCPKLVLHKADFMFGGKTHTVLFVFKLSCEKNM